MVIITQFDGNTGAKKIAQRGTKFMKNYKLNSTNELTSSALFSCQEIDLYIFFNFILSEINSIIDKITRTIFDSNFNMLIQHFK